MSDSASDLPDLALLRRTAHAVAADWGLDLGAPFALSRYSFVAPAGDQAVLKVTPEQDDESDQEADALALWAGDGAVRLLRCDRARRALLIERARPGGDISELPEDRATAVAVASGLRLWRAATAPPFRFVDDHVPDWLQRARPGGPVAAELLGLAHRLYDPAVGGRATLVHGDFHHHNILAAGDRHVAIDPKPMLGEPEFDVASFLWNPLPFRMTRESAETRLDAFAAAGLDQARMRRWAVIRGAYLGAGEDEAAVLLELAGATGR